MFQLNHTYGPTCHLARTVSFSGSKGDDDDVPSIKAQFFYSSPLHIDDPLSAVPAPSGSEFKAVKHPPRPFSAHDNNALEEAWIGLASKKDKKRHKKYKTSVMGGKISVPSVADNYAAKRNKGRGTTQGFTSSNASASKTGHGAQEPISTKASICALDKPGKTWTHAEPIKKDEEFVVSASTARARPDPLSNAENTFTTNGTLEAKPIKVSKSTQKGETSTRIEEEGTATTTHTQSSNANDQVCEDADHTPSSSSAPLCCAEFDSDSKGEHTGPLDLGDLGSPEDAKSKQAAKERSEKQKEVGQGQGNLIEERLTKIATKQCDVLESKEHKSFEKHEQSRDQQFSKHGSFRPKHRLGLQDLDENKIKSVEKLEMTRSNEQKKPQMPKTSSSDSVPASQPMQSDGSGTTRMPFLKFPSRKESPQPQSSHSFTHEEVEIKKCTGEQNRSRSPFSHRAHERDSTETEPLHIHNCRSHKITKSHTDVPVGISRLHLVKLPVLQMKPIYWSPVHDISVVTRGTWFYKHTMYPVEPAVANQLEMGYRALRPWSQTWSDELNSAMEVGAAGEEKITHQLWPKEELKSDLRRSTEHCISTDPQCAARCFEGEAAAEGSPETDNSDEGFPAPKTTTKRYPNSQVIFKDAQNSFILKPNLQPSDCYGRKPLQKIKKGITVGIHCVRGFDWKSWQKLYPSKISNMISTAEANAPVSGEADAAKMNSCEACRSQEERTKVTDLILVIHGIGQKLSERVESFHFTHSINAFRRSVNVELGNEAVKRVLREGLGGVMVLPVNWRSNLSFEEGGPMKEGDKDKNYSDFSLKEITPDTIPAIRNLISDVMLDIPFYMSDHKPKMIQALISEANRVYRLWCKNNPEFHKEGRVHIIAHSLGSVMAVEVLSKQPTSIPKLDLNRKKIPIKHFDFNTTNLFFVGSPAGFFLLLDKGKLTPRRGQQKPDAEPSDDQDKSIASDAGSFGCMAVHNIYNIMHYNDPIAYRLNATVDPQCAASLKNAQVPSATTGFFEGIGNAMRLITPGVSAPADLAVGQVTKAPGMARLPSQLEMEVHDFTREEVAERKFYLLNDNGQVDWFLSSGGGPLEIQYLNMLGAHSSYWGSTDFIRMVVTEVGREPGRNHSLPNMRVVKIGHKA